MSANIFSVLRSKGDNSNHINMALLANLGGLVAIISDIYWLYGDMQHAPLDHHNPVAVGLCLSVTIVVSSFLWSARLISRESKRIDAKKESDRYRQSVRDELKYRSIKKDPTYNTRIYTLLGDDLPDK